MRYSKNNGAVANIYTRNVLKTEIDSRTNEIRMQIGDSESSEIDAEASYYGPPGYFSLPSNPSADTYCATGLFLEGPMTDQLIGVSDVRSADLYGNLKPGEVAIVGAGERGDDQGRILIKQKGIISLLTSKSFKDPAMNITLDPEQNNMFLLNSKGDGIIIAEDKLSISFGSFSLTTDGTDLTIKTGGQILIDGSSIALGAAAVPGAGAALHGPTGVSGVPSLKVIME